LWIFCAKSSGFADFQNTEDRGSAVNFGANSGLYLSWCLGLEIWIKHLSSALVGVLYTFMSSSKLFLFSNEAVIGIVLCYSHQACCLLYYLWENKNGIPIYQFTFEFLHFCFCMWLCFQIWTKILADRRIWWKKGTDLRIFKPQFTPLIYRNNSATIVVQL